jgi:hypothetical protein
MATEFERLIVESVQDDWMSDHEVQSDYQAEFSLTAAEAYVRMILDLPKWIKLGILIPGDILNGFEAWPGGPESLRDRFAGRAARLVVIEAPGQICWFDLGSGTPSRLSVSRGLSRVRKGWTPQG